MVAFNSPVPGALVSAACLHLVFKNPIKHMPLNHTAGLTAFLGAAKNYMFAVTYCCVSLCVFTP